ncbi:dihydroorotate dehydrogenase [Anaeromicrobium sediminis]|uniref:Dihydroorotate dehydrogenase n=1 Tax=Anaeromicrobium sediminis TaxID=1478221 RepID=A0A267M9S3_9FIRM|nr:dihydroorotate dehydrogenase [Anaeromicrobium sediminis]PAB56172.1 dihydroorotate dehydrogenase B catalytic subunit [Anaeromicrobium sediminis]
MSNMEVKFCDISFKNPLVTGSGTFGFGREYENFYDLSKLGGISTKGLTLNPKSGNKGARLYETPSGLLNSIGLENPGVDRFIREELPYMKKLGTNIIANVGGATMEDYEKAIELVSKEDVDIIELNISCPNVKSGGMMFGLDEVSTGKIVKKIRSITRKPLVVKLSPNAENIVRCAQACEAEGADGVSLVNTFKGMAIDIKSRKKVFENTYAGLSGPAIKPIALRMVHEVSKNVNIPIIGMGGIMNYKDAIEFIMAGATLVSIGTANFINPSMGEIIVNDLKAFMEKENIKSFEEIRGII